MLNELRFKGLLIRPKQACGEYQKSGQIPGIDDVLFALPLLESGELLLSKNGYLLHEKISAATGLLAL